MSELNELKSNSGDEPELDEDGQPIKQTTRLQLLFRIFLVVLGMFLIFCTIGYCMPREYTVESSIVIDTAPEDIFPWLVRLDLWKEWSPAWDFDANEQINNFHFTHDFKGVTWRHEMRGVTSVWIHEAKLNEEIVLGLEDATLKDLTMVSVISLSLTDNGQTEVTWNSVTKLPRSPITSGVFYGWGGLMYNAGLRGQYERDLVRLKELCEKTSERPEVAPKKKQAPSVTPF